MKRAVAIILSAIMAAGCTSFSIEHSINFTHSGCANQTKGLFGNDDEKPMLYLEYTSKGLAVTRTNAMMNCIIKTDKDALVCDVEIKGEDIYYCVHEWDGPVANCICPVEKLSSTVTGLKENTEYVLHYTCGGSYLPINFRYHKGLKLKLNLEQYED